MVQRVATVAFEGIEVRPVDVQVQVAPGMPAFAIVGLPDKAVTEARERVRSALIASGLALPARRITINLAPADLPKEGSHYDLPIALGLMAAIGAIPHDALAGFTVLGELGLDGSIGEIGGVKLAASEMALIQKLSEEGRGKLCGLHRDVLKFHCVHTRNPQLVGQRPVEILLRKETQVEKNSAQSFSLLALKSQRSL